MVVTAPRIDDVNSLFAACKAFFDERQKHAVVIVVAVEERADVASVAKDRATEPNRQTSFLGIVAVNSA